MANHPHESPAAHPEPKEQRVQPSLVIGLGASAGGIKALQQFFANVPARSGAAYVVILHLSPDHDSMLAEVLQTTASIPVEQVRERVTIEPDHVYVIPPHKGLVLDGGDLVLSEMTRVEQRRAPVDIFFRTLADANGTRAVAVVLSGTGPNGSSGIKRVKEHGGLVIAQDPDESDYAEMPRNSIATGLVDFILPVAEMPRRILDCGERLHETHDGASLVPQIESDAESLREVLMLLRVRTGQDFSNYKPATIRRRIERRLSLRGSLTTLADYAGFMRGQPDEAAALLKELLISVTNFFRDPEAFAALESRVIPRLFATKGVQGDIRVWVAGCATGEEAYSIAMLLSEYGETTLDRPNIQVFATDLDAQAIATAREGFYSDAEVADVSEARLRTFFHREPSWLPRPAGPPRDGALCASQRHSRSTVLSSRSGRLPQCADLPESVDSGAGDRDVSFRPASGWVPVRSERQSRRKVSTTCSFPSTSPPTFSRPGESRAVSRCRWQTQRSRPSAVRCRAALRRASMDGSRRPNSTSVSSSSMGRHRWS